MSRKRTIVRLLVLFLTALPWVASAAVRVDPILRLRVEGRYDSNLAEGGSDGSGLLQPGIGFRLQAPTAQAQLAYTFEHLSYATPGEGRGGVNHRLLGEQELRFDRRTVLSLSQGLEQVYDPTSLSRAGVVRSAGRSSYAALQGDLSHRLSQRWTLGLRMREELTRIDAEGAFDGSVHAPEALATFAVSRLDILGAGYRLQVFDTIGAPTTYGHEARLRYERRLSPFVRLGLEAGPAIYSAGGTDSLLPVGAAELGFLGRRLALGLRLDRSLEGATGFPGALWGETVTASAGWRIGRPLRATLGLAAFRNGLAPAEPSFVNGLAGAAVFEYDLSADLAVQAVWRRVLQSRFHSEVFDLGDIDRNVVSIGFSWQLDRPRFPR